MLKYVELKNPLDMTRAEARELFGDASWAVNEEAITENLQCSSNTLATFARAGMSYIDPLVYDQHVFSADEIRSKINSIQSLQNSKGV